MILGELTSSRLLQYCCEFSCCLEYCTVAFLWVCDTCRCKVIVIFMDDDVVAYISL